VVFSVSLRGARLFSALLREGRIHKRYLALAEGAIEGPGLWEDPLFRDREARRTLVSAGGKAARTRFSPLGVYGGKKGAYSLLALEPETGRCHQIRAQAAAHGHPLGGDKKYGGRPLPAAFSQAAFFPAAFSQAAPRRAGQGPLPRHFTRPPFLLHAWKLIPPPEMAIGCADGGEIIPPLEAPPPDYFLALIERLFGQNWQR
jgi:23S rRNA pseudouridine955/2504/2580 synthase